MARKKPRLSFCKVEGSIKEEATVRGALVACGDTSTVECGVCGEVVETRGRGLTNLHRHLLRRHYRAEVEREYAAALATRSCPHCSYYSHTTRELLLHLAVGHGLLATLYREHLERLGIQGVGEVEGEEMVKEEPKPEREVAKAARFCVDEPNIRGEAMVEVAQYRRRRRQQVDLFSIRHKYLFLRQLEIWISGSLKEKIPAGGAAAGRRGRHGGEGGEGGGQGGLSPHQALHRLGRGRRQPEAGPGGGGGTGGGGGGGGGGG